MAPAPSVVIWSAPEETASIMSGPVPSWLFGKTWMSMRPPVFCLTSAPIRSAMMTCGWFAGSASPQRTAVACARRIVGAPASAAAAVVPASTIRLEIFVIVSPFVGFSDFAAAPRGRSVKPPLTPPAVRPPTISFWISSVSSSTGSVTSSAAAASGPHATCSNVSMLKTATGSVRVCRPPSTAPKTKLFQEKMIDRMEPTTIPGPRQRQRHVAERLPQRAAVDQGGLFELRRQALEEADHHVDEDRQRDHQMRDDERPDRAGQADPLEQDEERDQVRQGRRDARDQRQHRQLVRLRLGDAVGSRHPDEDRHQRGAARDDDAVPEIDVEMVFLDDVDEVRERGRARHEDPAGTPCCRPRS